MLWCWKKLGYVSWQRETVFDVLSFPWTKHSMTLGKWYLCPGLCLFWGSPEACKYKSQCCGHKKTASFVLHFVRWKSGPSPSTVGSKINISIARVQTVPKYLLSRLVSTLLLACNAGAGGTSLYMSLSAEMLQILNNQMFLCSGPGWEWGFIGCLVVLCVNITFPLFWWNQIGASYPSKWN